MYTNRLWSNDIFDDSIILVHNYLIRHNDQKTLNKYILTTLNNYIVTSGEIKI